MYLCPMRTFFYTICPITAMNLEMDFKNRNCPVSPVISRKELYLTNYIRMLWEQHVAWTRMTLISMTSNLEDTELVINRLLQNPSDFETLLKPFYGNKIALKFKDLLKNHLTIAAQLVKAAKSGDSQTATDAEKNWYANADEIAILLSNINPYWSEDAWKTMLYKHLELTKSEAIHMLTKNYTESIKIYDEIEKQALEMADMMTNGIINHFSHTFQNEFY